MFEPELAEAILADHYRKPHHRGECEAAGATGDTTNPLCGDEITLSLRLAEGRVACARFTGQGCAVSQAGASLVMDLLQDRPVEEAQAVLEALLAGLRDEPVEADLGNAAALLSLRHNPARVVCAGLAAELALQLLGEGA